MKTNLYATYDMKMKVFGRVFQEKEDAAAIRSFTDAVNDNNPNNMWYKHPEDFALYKIGEYDDETGVVENVQLQSLVTATAIRIIDQNTGEKENAQSIKHATTQLLSDA